ncbi:PEP-CTERM sorting domain-containing protein [Janthinobacterium fluminis]|uniref:PEP-CTERM sorting domain-containing protein n=1 Tax=Janthinobacterium fluminis TaxID=2987524 RepID=A0ABT5K5P2_9BURK|nr:PEP-CTERM sorting domain-containing protein [Janthinobacterium fluminis]MDC8760314.1 PEP-CTERM sorting domain-containing protein [Janthinobacterium fluminis]
MRSLPATAAAALGAAVLSLAGGNAFAYPDTGSGGKAGARLTGVRFGVIDLRLDDGQAAGFSTVAGNSELRVWHGWPDGVNRLDLPPLQAGQVGITDWSKTVAGTLGNYGELYANAEVNYGNYDGNDLGSSAMQRLQITLAPHSALSLAGTASASAQRDPNWPDHHNEISSAYSTIFMRSVSSPDVSVSYQQRVDSSKPYFASEDFMLVYANPSDRPLLLTVQFDTGAYATSPSIPEPGGYAMMGAGLLLIGALGRRKRGARA